jgi:hypothetical protein
MFALAMHTKSVILGHGKAHKITKQQNQKIKKILQQLHALILLE